MSKFIKTTTNSVSIGGLSDVAVSGALAVSGILSQNGITVPNNTTMGTAIISAVNPIITSINTLQSQATAVYGNVNLLQSNLISNVSSLQSQVTGVYFNVTLLQSNLLSNVSSLQSQSSNVYANVASLQTLSSGVYANVASLQTLSSGVYANVASLQTLSAGVYANVAVNSSNITTILGNVTSLQSLSSGVYANVASLQTLSSNVYANVALVQKAVSTQYRSTSSGNQIFTTPISISDQTLFYRYDGDPNHYSRYDTACDGVCFGSYSASRFLVTKTNYEIMRTGLDANGAYGTNINSYLNVYGTLNVSGLAYVNGQSIITTPSLASALSPITTDMTAISGNVTSLQTLSSGVYANVASLQATSPTISGTNIFTGTFTSLQTADALLPVTYSTTPSFSMTNGMVYSLSTTSTATTSIGFTNLPSTPQQTYVFTFILLPSNASNPYYLKPSTNNISVTTVGGTINTSVPLYGIQNIILPPTYTYMVQQVTIVNTSITTTPSFLGFISVNGY